MAAPPPPLSTALEPECFFLVCDLFVKDQHPEHARDLLSRLDDPPCRVCTEEKSNKVAHWVEKTAGEGRMEMAALVEFLNERIRPEIRIAVADFVNGFSEKYAESAARRIVLDLDTLLLALEGESE